MDDDFMTRCFEDCPECTELVLHIILNKPDLKVHESKSQYSIKNLTGRSVRLDVYATDSEGRRYNIEIQRSEKGASVRRARYNSSLIDADSTLPGDDYDALPESYVIFITDNDVLKGNRPLYRFSRMEEESGLLLGDGSHIIYVNGAWQDESPLGLLMRDFHCTIPDRMHYGVLSQRTRYYKEDEKGVGTMCKAFEAVMAEGIEKGMKQGIEKGRNRERIQRAMKSLRSGRLNLDGAIEVFDLTDTDIALLRQMLEQESLQLYNIFFLQD